MKTFRQFILETGYDAHPHTPHYEGGKEERVETHKILPTEAHEEHYHTDPESKRRVEGLRQHIKAGGKTHKIAVRKIPAKDIKKGHYLGMKLHGHTHAIIDGAHRWAAHKAEGTSHMQVVTNPKRVE